MRFKLLIIGLLFSFCINAQEVKYFKDENFSKEVSKKRAKYKIEEETRGDTLFTRAYKISDNLLISESKWYDDKPVGVWREYNTAGKLVSERDFNKVIYTRENTDSLFNSSDENHDCESCVPASFPGGESKMFEFFSRNIKYPNESKRSGGAGVVYIQFIIDKNGNVEPYMILRGVDPFIDLEAWTLVERMPKWEPATKDGELIDTVWNLPLRFKLR